jgi:hypothetical protein
MKPNIKIGGRLLLALPSLLGTMSMLWILHETHFFSIGYGIVLLTPFLIVGFMAWHACSGIASTISILCATLLLWALPLACYKEGFSEGCQYMLALSPIYLWPIVGIAAIVNIFISSRIATTAD